jgi:DNA polymerase
MRCGLCESRTTVVFGEGNSNRPRIAFIGEAPGMYEDEQGRPFVGQGGRLLNKMITAIGLAREDVYLCNVVNCITPNSRTPEADEVESCKPFWIGQMRIVQPEVIVTLGATATQAITRSKKKLPDLRGKWFEWKDTSKGSVTYGLTIPLRATYHPSVLLRSPEAKKEAWKDLQIVQTWINRNNERERDNHDNS